MQPSKLAVSLHEVYAQAYYRAQLNWDWEYDQPVKRKHWSAVKAWIFKRMQKASKLEMLSVITRSLD